MTDRVRVMTKDGEDVVLRRRSIRFWWTITGQRRWGMSLSRRAWWTLRWWTGFVLLLASGCAYPDTTIYVDRRFSPDEEAQIAEAAAAWDVATGGAVRFDLAFGAAAIGTRASRRREIVRLDPEEAVESEFYEIRDEREPAAVRFGEDYRIVLVVPERLDGWSLRVVVMHELAHVIGLEHVAEPFALMSERPVRAIERFADEGCLSGADLWQLVRVDVDVTRARVCGQLENGVVVP